SYPVLAPVSEGYPKAEGRLLTCYSPVRRSSTPKGAFPHDLHVLSTPPAFVLSQDQTLQQKPGKLKPQQTPPPQRQWPKFAKGTPTTTRRNTNPRAMARGHNQQTIGTGINKNTLLSSQRTTTHNTNPTTGPASRQPQ